MLFDNKIFVCEKKSMSEVTRSDWLVLQYMPDEKLMGMCIWRLMKPPTWLTGEKRARAQTRRRSWMRYTHGLKLFEQGTATFKKKFREFSKNARTRSTEMFLASELRRWRESSRGVPSPTTWSEIRSRSSSSSQKSGLPFRRGVRYSRFPAVYWNNGKSQIWRGEFLFVGWRFFGFLGENRRGWSDFLRSYHSVQGGTWSGTYLCAIYPVSSKCSHANFFLKSC